MRKIVLTILSIIMINLVNAQTSIAYTDGSNNTYIITKKNINYVAIKKENSSSGIYSGGKDVNVAIDANQYKQIKTFIKKLETDKTNISKERNMGCGTLENKNKPIYIAMNSPLKKEFEDYLKKIIK